MATRLQDMRDRDQALKTETRVELTDKGTVFHPNLFIDIVEGGISLWSEDGTSFVLPDAALTDVKKRLTYLLGNA